MTDDPAQAVAQAILGAAEANQAAASDIARLVEAVKVEASQIVANRAAEEMHQTARMILLRHNKWVAVWTGLAGAALLGLGVLIGLLIAPAKDVRGMTCQDQDGGRVCFMWVTPPPGQIKR